MTSRTQVFLALIGLLLSLSLVHAKGSESSEIKAVKAIKEAKCVTDEFYKDTEFLSYFKALVYDGMLAECQMSSLYKKEMKIYAKYFSKNIVFKSHNIMNKCDVNSEKYLLIMQSYAAGARTGGALSLWRLIDQADKNVTCNALLMIIRSKME